LIVFDLFEAWWNKKTPSLWALLFVGQGLGGGRKNFTKITFLEFLKNICSF
jgi:hypothetical protein